MFKSTSLLKKSKIKENFDHIINLPTSIKEVNRIIEDIFAKKRFNKNSSIEVKSYILDKNEKKLVKKNNFVILTEKEIQLIELFLNSEKPISKKNILSFVWNYSSDADTHTVETHIYRLRKKIKDKFFDEEFLLNDKDLMHDSAIPKVLLHILLQSSHHLKYCLF